MTESEVIPRDRLRWRILELGLAIGIAIFVVYCLTGFRFATLFTDEDRQHDFLMWYLLPPQIGAVDYPSAITGNWKIAFPYVPSAVTMLLPLSWMSQPVAFAVWMVLQCISLVVVLWISLQIVGLAQSRARLPIAAAAVFIASSPLQWDLRTHNNNLIYLALVMLALRSHRTWIAGTLFAVTANLKLYSGALIAGFLLRREYRLAASMTLIGLLIAIGLPIAAFGYPQFIKLIPSWFEQIRYTVSPAGQIVVPVSIPRTIAALLDQPSASAVRTISFAVQLLWVGIVAGYFVAVARLGALADRNSIARFCDILVLLLFPLLLSSWLVAYHALVLLPAFVLILSKLIDQRAPYRVRAIAAAAVAGNVVMHFAVRAWDLRAGVYVVDFILVVLALGAIRVSLARPSVSGLSRATT